MALAKVSEAALERSTLGLGRGHILEQAGQPVLEIAGRGIRALPRRFGLGFGRAMAVARGNQPFRLGRNQLHRSVAIGGQGALTLKVALDLRVAGLERIALIDQATFLGIEAIPGERQPVERGGKLGLGLAKRGQGCRSVGIGSCGGRHLRGQHADLPVGFVKHTLGLARGRARTLPTQMQKQRLQTPERL